MTEIQKIELKNEDALKLTNVVLEEINHPYKAISVDDIGAGMTHQNKTITLENKTELVLRWIQPGLHPNPARREDSYFGGERSIFREAKLLDITRNQAELPASKVYYVGDREEGKILLVEKVPGKLFREFIEDEEFSHRSFLKALEYFGEDMAKAHSIHFDLYGSVQKAGLRNGKQKYGDDLKEIISRHTVDHLEMLESYFSEKELQEVFDYFDEVCKYANNWDEDKVKPSFVLYDQHSKNFFVNEKGKPSGYFDIEYGRAAHPNLELGSTALQLFGFVSGENEKQAQEYVKQARESFMKGYLRNGGLEIINDDALETVHAANHIFSAVKSYHNKRDGIRNNWSQAFADMVLGMTREGKINCYFAFTDLIRGATKQPAHPN